MYLYNVQAHNHVHDGASAKIMYQWNIIEYEWPNDTIKEQEIANGNYIPQNSAVNGIKLYNGSVYVTVPRLKPGVPSTLNVIIKAPESFNESTHLLRPFPNWEMQKLGHCDSLQRVQSMEIDPQTGFMWILDTGKSSIHYLYTLHVLLIEYNNCCMLKILSEIVRYLHFMVQELFFDLMN